MTLTKQITLETKINFLLFYLEKSLWKNTPTQSYVMKDEFESLSQITNKSIKVKKINKEEKKR